MAGHPKRIRVIDPADGHIVREIGLGEHAEGMGGLFVEGTSYWLGPEQEGMIEQHSLGDNTVLTTFGVVPSAEGITIIGSTLWYTSYRQRLLAMPSRMMCKGVQEARYDRETWARCPNLTESSDEP